MTEQKLKLYKVVNPHDPWTFYAPTIQIAAAATGVLGSSYGASCVETGEGTPTVMGWAKWIEQHGITPEWFEENIGAVIDALESFICCTPEKRPVFDQMLARYDEGARQACRRDHLKNAPGSTVNLGEAAQRMATFYRKNPLEEGADE